MIEVERAMDRLSQLTQRVIELARRLKTDRVRVPSRQDDGLHGLPSGATVAPSDDLA